LAEEPNTSYRLNAAKAAAQAGCGLGEDAADLPAPERAKLRQQAADWLRAELAAWSRIMKQGAPMVKQQGRANLATWLREPLFACVRDEKALAELPEDEACAWQAFWHEVRELAEGTGTPPP